MANGTIHSVHDWTVCCADYSEWHEGCSGLVNMRLLSRSEYITNIRLMGWKTRGGKWYCPACAARREKGKKNETQETGST